MSYITLNVDGDIITLDTNDIEDLGGMIRTGEKSTTIYFKDGRPPIHAGHSFNKLQDAIIALANN